MAIESFEVTSYKLDDESAIVFWQGVQIATKGHLLCTGNDYRFIVFFLSEESELPLASYMPEYKLAAVFAFEHERESYMELLKADRVYACMSTHNADQNLLTIQKPVRYILP